MLKGERVMRRVCVGVNGTGETKGAGVNVILEII